MKRTLGVAAVVLVLAGCGGASHPSATPATKTVTVKPTPKAQTLTVKGALDTTSATPESADGWQGVKCRALQEPSIHVGTQVMVYSPSGSIVGVGQLRQGWLHGGATCRFPFTVTGVPATWPIYQVQVARTGKVTFKRAQLSRAMLEYGF